MFLLLAMIAIQVRQVHFRSQVERLHSEILALQLHPGTFADILRLQREWGAYGDYTGPCTEHHCIYEIEFENGWLNRPRSEGPYHSFIPRRWFFGIYPLFGGHAARVQANVRVRDNKVWGADFTLGIAIYPGQGRNEGDLYENIAILASSTRVSHHHELSRRDIQQGFRTHEILNCLGCEYVVVQLTPETKAADIERFNQIRFNCLTGWRSCKHPIDLAPELWEQALKDEQSPQGSEEESWLLPPHMLAREMNNIVFVKVLAVEAGQDVSPGVGPHHDLTVKVLQPMKNSRAYRAGDVLKFYASPSALWTGDGNGRSPLVVGSECFFFYEYFFYTRRGPDQIWSPTRGLWLARALPNTPEIAEEIKQGIALDPSAGEPYDFRDEPYVEQ